MKDPTPYELASVAVQLAALDQAYQTTLGPRVTEQPPPVPEDYLEQALLLIDEAGRLFKKQGADV